MNILIVSNNNTDNLLIESLNKASDSVFVLKHDESLQNHLKDIDVIYFLSLDKKIIKEALKQFVPMVTEYFGYKSKRDYKEFYRYMNAIHFLKSEDKDFLELSVKRRVNAHVFDETEDETRFLKIRKMLLQYSAEENHNGKKKFYYRDEVNDDFAVVKIQVKKQKPFKYIHTNPFWRFFGSVLYYVIAKPICFLTNKIVFHQRIRNKAVLKKCKHKGYFIYANHTQGVADAFTPNILTKKRNHIVVSRETVSIKGIKGIVTMLGAIPVFQDANEAQSFNECIKTRIKQGRSITIYPEAHIWPLYTKIREFKKDSFRFPVDLNAPVYVITNTWQKRSFTKNVKLVSYLTGPLLPDESLPRNEAIEDLRNRVLFEMIRVGRSAKQRSKNQYIKVEKD